MRRRRDSQQNALLSPHLPLLSYWPACPASRSISFPLLCTLENSLSTGSFCLGIFTLLIATYRT